MALSHFSARHFGAVSLTTLRGGGGIVAVILDYVVKARRWCRR